MPPMPNAQMQKTNASTPLHSFPPGPLNLPAPKNLLSTASLNIPSTLLATFPPKLSCNPFPFVPFLSKPETTGTLPS